jgi:glycosyltransferase involved in cell wall biosynthesis
VAQLVAAGTVGVRFLIVGDVADGQHRFREALLARVAAAGLQREVLFLGFTPEVDVVWAASDIAVVPSIEPEPFGRVAIEAMAHALPVVAAAHGGLTEIVEHERTGLLVAPGSAQALAQALQRLLADADLRHRFGLAGQQRQRAVFTQRRHDEQVLAVVDQLVAKS